MPTVNRVSLQYRLDLAEMLESCSGSRKGGCEGCGIEAKCNSIWNSISANMTISPKAFEFYKRVLNNLREMKDQADNGA